MVVARSYLSFHSYVITHSWLHGIYHTHSEDKYDTLWIWE